MRKPSWFKKQSLNNFFKIYPNPVKAELRIESDLYSAKEEITIKPVNAPGLVIREQAMGSQASVHILNMRDVAEGIYLLQVFDKGKLVAVKKVVKE